MADVAELIVALRLQDGVSSGLGRLNGQLRGMQGGLAQVSTGIGQVGRGLDTALTRGAIAAGGALAFVVHSAVEFEDAFTGVAKTVDASESQLADLSDEIRAMSREMPIAATELANIAEQAGALGVAVADIDEFTRVAALIGVTTDVSSDQAATALGQLSNVLSLTGEDYERFASTLVDLGNKGASTESAILDIATRAGAAGDLIGLSADQVLAFGSAAANLGIEAEAAGSALQRFFIDTLTNVQDDDLLGVMARTAGTTGAAFKQAFEEDAAGALNVFVKGLGKLDEAAQIETLQTLGFNDVRITRLLLGFANNTDNLTDSLNTAHVAFEANVALQTEAERKFANTASQLKILKNNVTDAAVTIGNELLPVIVSLSRDFVGFLNQPGTQRAIKEFAEGLAGGIRSFAAEIKGADFGPLLETLKGAASIARGAFEAFNALPGPVKQLALAALVANKVTGGAVGGIAAGLGNIAGGLIKIAFERGGSPANPLWVQSVGGIGGGVPGVPGGGGFVGGLGRGLATGGILGGAAVLTGIAAVEVVNFQEMRTEGQAGLQASLDGMRRDDVGNTNRAIAAINAQINMERPFLEGLLFTTNIKPQLDIELAELRQTRTDLARNIVRGTDETSRRIDGVNANLDLERAASAAYQAADAARIQGLRDSHVSAIAAQTANNAARLGELRDSHTVAIAGVSGRLDVSNVHLANISAKNFTPIVKVDTHVSLQEWQRTEASATRARSAMTIL